MGATFTIPEEELKELSQSTVFKRHQLKRWYTKFMKSYPEGKLGIEEFNEVYSKLDKTKESQTRNFSQHIFRSFDRDNNGFISFKELMLSFSVASCGTRRERLEWVFNFFNFDRSGKISMENICDIAQSISYESRNNTDSMKVLDAAELFIRVDKDFDGYWTLDEFIEGVHAYPCVFKRTLGVR